ncbi:MAG: glycosyl hydrolase [Sphingobacteriia bacterium]|jgi:hypothetical protein
MPNFLISGPIFLFFICLNLAACLPGLWAQPLASDFWGMHVHAGAHFPTQAPFGSLRLWDSQVCWYQLEPTQDTWNWATLDARVSQAEAQGISITYVLGQTPTWATANPQDTISPYCHGCNHNPRVLADWEDYVRQLVRRYRGRIQAYELWNEPNYRLFYNQPADSFITLVRAAVPIIRAEDPAARIVSPGIIANDWKWQNTDGPTWLRQYFARAEGRNCDAVGIHLYTREERPLEQELLPLIDTVRHCLQELGMGSYPIWDTETGYGNAETANQSKVLYYRGDSAQACVARAHLLRWMWGIQRYYWYMWDNLGWVGLYMLQPDYEAPTAGQLAYRRLRQWLLGARLIRHERQDGRWMCEIEKDGLRSYILWHESKATEWAVPAAWRVHQLHHLDGTAGPLPAVLSVGPVPILLTP